MLLMEPLSTPGYQAQKFHFFLKIKKILIENSTGNTGH